MEKKRRDRMMKEFYGSINKQSIIPDIKQVSLRYCEHSMTYRLNNRWKEYDDLSEVLHKTVLSILKKKIGKDVDIKVDPVMKGEKIKELIITAKRGKDTEQKRVKAIVDKTMNPSLSKKFSKSLEGTLQLRNVDERMFERLQEELERSEKNFCHVTELREKGTSIDIDLTSQKEIEHIAKSMQKEFGGELKMDYKLHTRDRQTQKELHRLTATVRFPDVKKGDIISAGDNAYEVLGMIGDKMKLLNLDTGKKESIGQSEEHEKLTKTKAVVAQTNPEIMAIDPETYQMVQVILKNEKNSKKIRIDQKLDVVKSNRKLYSIKK